MIYLVGVFRIIERFSGEDDFSIQEKIKCVLLVLKNVMDVGRRLAVLKILIGNKDKM